MRQTIAVLGVLGLATAAHAQQPAAQKKIRVIRPARLADDILQADVELPIEELVIKRVIVGTTSLRSGPSTLQRYATAHIKQMTTVCGLTAGQQRTLSIAAKGVAHRARQAAAGKPQQRLRREVIIEDLGMRLEGARIRHIQPMRSQQFHKQLTQHRIWTQTLARVLTPEQRKTWAEFRKEANR